MGEFVHACSQMRLVCAQRVAGAFDLDDYGAVSKPVQDCMVAT